MTDEIDLLEGLGLEPKDRWPTVSAADTTVPAIDRLEPKSKLHQTVLKHLITRLDMSEREMQKFYPRWRAGEKRTQAYIDLADWEKTLKEMNDSGKAPKVVSITVPYTFATIWTIVTYLVHTFCGRKPMFQVASYKKEAVKASQMMEQVLQFNSDHTRLIKHLFQYFQDGEQYGVGIIRTRWETQKAMRTVWRDQSQGFNFFGMGGGTQRVKVREERTVYAGNEAVSQDPFMFFPDPRVPMHEVNRKGEFVFWRNYDGLHSLKREQASGRFKWVEHAGQMPHNTTALGDSSRHLLSGGNSHPGQQESMYTGKAMNYIQVDQGTCEIIPAELGLGTSDKPEKWLFTIANKNQIIQAEPFDYDHGMHPVAVIEPYTMGYGFGQAGISDYLGPTQDTLSWLVNSHIDNVRTALNNMFVVDPSMVEMQDLKNPGPGKIIRLKQTALGRDVRSVLQQMNVADVTSSHMKDLEMFMRMGDSLSSITDNLRGLQDSGGRKTATEVRTSGEAGASRLAAHARLISAQGVVDLAEQMCLNNQQFLEEAFYIQLLGQEAQETGLQVNPEQLVGDFYFPVHDGTLPLDRVAMLDVWKEIFIAVSQDEQLRTEFSVPKIFDYLAELGGAKNLDAFKVNLNPAAPGADLEGAAAAGSMVPTEIPGLGGGGARV